MTNVFSKINKNETMLETYKKNEKKKNYYHNIYLNKKKVK